MTKLSEIDPDSHGGKTKDEVVDKTAENIKAIDELSYRLYAEGKKALLIVLQGMDTAGKDGVIRHVASINPQNCSVVPFKVPTAEEQAHDFLWRIHAKAPRHGQIVIFNRSYYEADEIEQMAQQLDALLALDTIDRSEGELVSDE